MVNSLELIVQSENKWIEETDKNDLGKTPNTELSKKKFPRVISRKLT